MIRVVRIAIHHADSSPAARGLLLLLLRPARS